MGLIFPGFTPSPLGEISEYAPSFGEIAVGVGVLAMGMLLFTLMAKVAIGIQMGELHEGGAVAPPVDTGHAPSVAHSPST
jgi:molybdopterin-containing oxidoreductase family membrane subunit